MNLLHLETARLWLAGIHPILPWLVLAAAFWALDKVLDATGSTAKLERAVPWGKAAARLIDTLPFVVLGAAWPLVSSGDVAMTSAVYGALAAAARPLVLAIKAWLMGPKPPDGGTPAGAVALLLACLLSAPFLTACTKQEVAKTVDQIACAAKVEARETLMLYAAGCIDLEYQPTGKCSDDQIDTIMTPFDVEGEACFQN